MSEEDKRLLSRSEVKAIYGIGVRFLELAPSRGNGPPFVRVGRSVRYRVADIEGWLLSNTSFGEASK